MWVIAVGALLSTQLLAARFTQSEQSAPSTCGRVDDPGSSAVLNCMTLIPVPDYPAAHATIQLRPVASPFGVSVRSDGRPRYRLIATFSGLAEARSLGAYSSYVAWAYTLSLDSAINLGPVNNGTVDLGEISLPQFRVFVSAEQSAQVKRRRGKLVLRGTSPSARLMAHRDVVQPAAPGRCAMPTLHAHVPWPPCTRLTRRAVHGRCRRCRRDPCGLA